MADRISATEARLHFGEVMDRVRRSGRPVVVEKAGRPHVVITSAECLLALEAGERRARFHEVVGQAAPRGRKAQERVGESGGESPAPGAIMRPVREDRPAGAGVLDEILALRRRIHERLAREGKTMPPATQIIREMREERDAYLSGLLGGDPPAGGPPPEPLRD